MHGFHEVENTTTDAAQCRFALVVEIHSWMSWNFVYEIINFIFTNVSKTCLFTAGAAGL